MAEEETTKEKQEKRGQAEEGEAQGAEPSAAASQPEQGTPESAPLLRVRTFWLDVLLAYSVIACLINLAFAASLRTGLDPQGVFHLLFAVLFLLAIPGLYYLWSWIRTVLVAGLGSSIAFNCILLLKGFDSSSVDFDGTFTVYGSTAYYGILILVEGYFLRHLFYPEVKSIFRAPRPEEDERRVFPQPWKTIWHLIVLFLLVWAAGTFLALAQDFVETPF